MKSKFYAPAAVLILTCAFGFYKSSTSFGGLVFIPRSSFGESRMPASVPRNLDFSYLQGSALREASQKRLVSDLKIWPEQKRVGIQLGHFITKGSDGRPALACEFYDRVTLNFQGEGSAENGEKPVMQVQAPCHESPDLAKMQTLWIATSRLTQAKPQDGEILFPDLNEEIKYTFSQMGSEWPTTWSLSSVRLSNDSKADREITVSGNEIRELRSATVVIHW